MSQQTFCRDAQEPLEENSITPILNYKKQSETKFPRQFISKIKIETVEDLHSRRFGFSHGLYEIQIDRKGDLWVGGYDKREVYHMDLKSRMVTTYKTAEPSGITFHPTKTNIVYITSEEVGQLSQLNTDNGLLDVLMTNLGPVRGLSFDRRGNLFLSVSESQQNHSIIKVVDFLHTSDLSTVKTVKYLPSSDHFGVWSCLVNPRNDTELFVSYFSSKSVIKTRDGQLIQAWKTGGSNDLCIYDNYLFVADNKGCIQVIDLDTGHQSILDIVFDSPYSIAVDVKNKYLYVSTAASITRLHISLPLQMFKTYPPLNPTDLIVICSSK